MQTHSQAPKFREHFQMQRKMDECIIRFQSIATFNVKMQIIFRLIAFTISRALPDVATDRSMHNQISKYYNIQFKHVDHIQTHSQPSKFHENFQMQRQIDQCIIGFQSITTFNVITQIIFRLKKRGNKRKRKSCFRLLFRLLCRLLISVCTRTHVRLPMDNTHVSTRPAWYVDP